MLCSADGRGRGRGGGFVALFHGALAGELHAALVIDADALDPDHVADLDDVLGAVDAEVGQLGDVDEAFLAGQDLDERAELLGPGDAAMVGLADG